MADTELQYLTKVGADRNPIQEERYQQLLKEQGGATVANDPTSLAQQMYGMLQQYKAPAIETLEASRGKIGDVFAP